jgi:hypothetical protein
VHSWTEVSVNVEVAVPPRPSTSLAQTHTRPGTALRRHSPAALRRKTVNLDPYVALPSRRASTRERIQQKGGAATTGIAWDWQKAGPFVTSLVLDSPRAPDFQIDMCMPEWTPANAGGDGQRARALSPERDALRAGVRRARVRSPWFVGKERAHLSDETPEGLSLLTADVNRLASQKVGILQEADSRCNFVEVGHEDLSDALQTQTLMQRNLKRLEEQGGIAELNTLRPREYTTRRVRHVSEHLLVSKSESKTPVKVKSFRVRQDELEQKIASFRENPGKLKRRAQQLKMEKLQANGGGSQIKEFRENLAAGTFGPQRAAELRTLRVLQEEVRLIAARQKHKKLLAEEIESTARAMQEKAVRKEEMRKETERKRRAARNMQLVQVLLPATFAAARLGLWANKVKTGRDDRHELMLKTEAVLVFQRTWKWKKWRRDFRNKVESKRILARHMWRICMQWRIRRKSRAVTRIVLGLREMTSRQPVVAAFLRYKYKIRIMQRVCRQAIQAIHSQILAVNVQYHKALAHYKKTQMDGAHTHVETSPKAKDRDNKQDKKKKGKKEGDDKPSAAAHVNFVLVPSGQNPVVQVHACVCMRWCTLSHLEEMVVAYQPLVELLPQCEFLQPRAQFCLQIMESHTSLYFVSSPVHTGEYSIYYIHMFAGLLPANAFCLTFLFGKMLSVHDHCLQHADINKLVCTHIHIPG